MLPPIFVAVRLAGQNAVGVSIGKRFITLPRSLLCGTMAPAWEWGQRGPGADALAYALCHYATGSHARAAELAPALVDAILATAPRCWSLRVSDLVLWTRGELPTLAPAHASAN